MNYIIVIIWCIEQVQQIVDYTGLTYLLQPALYQCVEPVFSYNRNIDFAQVLQCSDVIIVVYKIGDYTGLA